jgi:hypothetical protein
MPIRRNRSLLAAGEKIEICQPARVTTLGAAGLGRAWRPTDRPGRRGIVQLHIWGSVTRSRSCFRNRG